MVCFNLSGNSVERLDEKYLIPPPIKAALSMISVVESFIRSIDDSTEYIAPPEAAAEF